MQRQKSDKILIFSLMYLPYIGGAEVAIKEITERILDFEFDLIAARRSKDLVKFEKMGNVSVYRVGKGNVLDKYLYPVRAFLLAKKLYKKNKYDLVWAIMASWAGIAALFFKFRFRKVKYLLTMQSGDSDNFINTRTWFWKWFYKKVYTKADHIQAISNWLVERARKYGYKREVSLVPNGVNLEAFKTNDGRFDTQEIKKILNINEKDKVIFTSSRLFIKNGLSDLIHAVEILRKYYDLAVKLVIAGGGSLENKLKKLVRKLDIEKDVIFLGYVKNSEIAQFYAVADIFCRPSLSEGQGISFIEAMAAGVPVVATRVGGIPDFIEDGETGLLVEVHNPADVAEKLRILIQDEELCEHIKGKASALVREKYNWDNIAQDIGGIFIKTINR